LPRNRSCEAELGQDTSTCNFTWEELDAKSAEVSLLKTGHAHMVQTATVPLVKTDAEQTQYRSTDLFLNFHKTIRLSGELKVEYVLER